MSNVIKMLPVDDRPREKLIKYGASVLSDSELLAILIRTGMKTKSAIEIARELTADDGLYHNIAQVQSIAELSRVKGLGTAKAATILAALELGKRVAAAKPQVKVKFDSPQACAEYLQPKLRYEPKEKFVVLLLDSKNQLIRSEQISVGSVNEAIVHPREVYAPAILYHAVSILAAHNHPSGDPNPSREDKLLTVALKKTGAVIGIPLLDHIVVGDGRYFSFREQGYLEE